MNLSPVTLYRDFDEDRNASMDTYASSLAQALGSAACEAICIQEFKPSMPKSRIASILTPAFRRRYARYVAYPRQARANQGTINHILDQSYAHLLHVIDGRRSVVTVHDVIPILAWKGVIPGMSYPHYPLLYRLATTGFSKARAIIAVSENTKKDLVRHCGIPECKVTVVHNGIDGRFRHMSEDERAAERQRLGLPNRGAHVVLITGTQEYKNHRTSMKVMARLECLVKKPVQIVWLGAAGWQETGYTAGPLGKPIIYLKNLSTEELVSLYNAVDCLLFPSWYEGFGWPPVEAMACGTPAVTSNAGSLPEVAGDAALTAKAHDVEGLAHALRQMLEDEPLRRDYIERGHRNSARFTWTRCAAEVLRVYQGMDWHGIAERTPE